MRRFIKRLTSLALVSLLVAATNFTGALSLQTAYAAGEGISSVADLVNQPGKDLPITSIEITGTGNDSVSLRVEASGGELYLDDTTNVTVEWDNDDRVFTITGLRDDVNASLQTLWFYGAKDTYTVDLTLVDGDYNPENAHVYQVVTAPGISWADAKTAAEGMTNGGVNGYLATITSEAEHNFILDRINDSGWIGANDITAEGTWRWKTGPEAAMDGGSGLHFWTGEEDGSLVSEQYENWADSEPNNSGPGDGEDCAQIWFNGAPGTQGQWNDLSCTSPENDYYVVEFGAPGALPEVITDSFTIDMEGDTSLLQISSCDQLFELGPENVANNIELTADIDCHGRTEESLFDREDFYGIFNGNGFTIKNLILANEDNEHPGLTGYSVQAEWRNLFFDNITIVGNYHGGILAGHVNDGIIAENIHVTNSRLQGADYEAEGGDEATEIGMLFGTLSLNHEYESRIEHVSVQGEIEFEGVDFVENIGGIVGYIEVESDFVFEQVYADVDIITSTSNGDSSRIGGIVGEFEVDTVDDNDDDHLVLGIDNSYSWGSITDASANRAGGLAGYVDISTGEGVDTSFAVNNSYSWMDVTADEEVGGLIGGIDNVTDEGETYIYQINNSFYAGALNGSDTTGTIIGTFDDASEDVADLQFDNVWYDADKAGDYDCVSNVVMDECNAANEDGSEPNYFINNRVAAPIDTWNFDTIWRTNAGTPPVFKPFIGNDGDQDGANDYLEDHAPNEGDGNNDDTADSEQSHVASLVSPISGEYVTLAVDDSCELSQVSIASESSHSAKDGVYDYQAGFVAFTASGCDDGQASVELYYHGVALGNQVVRKYNPNTDSYFTITAATTASLTDPFSGTLVSYTVTDNGDLDINEEEGVITDPVGLATAVAGNATPSVGVPDTGLAETNTLPFILASTAGLGLLLVLASPLRKKVHGLVGSKK